MKTVFQTVNSWTLSPSIDVQEDRGCTVFETKELAEMYLKDRDFDACISVIPLEVE